MEMADMNLKTAVALIPFMQIFRCMKGRREEERL